MKLLKKVWENFRQYEHGTVMFFGFACFIVGFMLAGLISYII